MGQTILMTGATGAIGPHVIAELLRDDRIEQIIAVLRPATRPWQSRVNDVTTAVRHLRDLPEGSPALKRLVCVVADLRHGDLYFDHPALRQFATRIDTIVHGAADTRFAAAWTDLHAVNVGGTRRVVEFARQCRRLNQLLFVSTACVAGTTVGIIPECVGQAAPAFLNAYERSKWEAERVVAAAGLPTRIARLGTCLGGEQSGYVHRFGAVHQCLRWLIRGLLPMVPAVDGACVDLISTDVAAKWIARAATLTVESVEVCHVAAGRNAVALERLLSVLVSALEDRLPAWKHRQIEAPVVTDGPTFDLFTGTVKQSGDRTFARVLDSASAFVPGLLYPKIYDTVCAERRWGGPLPLSDWRHTLENVIDFGMRTRWHRPHALQVHHAC